MPRRLRTLAIGLFVVGAIVTGAIFLTPPTYRFLLAQGWIDADEFLKVLRRLLLVPLLIALFAWTRPWRDGGPRSYGLLGEHARPWLFALTWTVTLGVAVSILASHAAAGWLDWEDPVVASKVVRRAGRWIFLGAVLGLIEEWFFRGWLDRRIGRRLRPVPTALWVATVYAAVHAFKPSRLDVDITYDAAGAWDGLRWWLTHLVDPSRFGPTFMGLFLFSLVLTALWRRTRSLWAPIGVHAAGLFVLRSYGALTDRDPQRTWAGTKELFDGPPVWVLLFLVLGWLVSRPTGRGAAKRL